MTKSNSKSAPAPMAQTERRALAKIIDARFKSLQSELDTRREQIEDATRDRLITEAEEACREAKRRTEEFVVRARELEDDLRAFIVEMGEELGVEPGSVQTYREYTPNPKNQGRRVIRTSPSSLVNVTISNEWAPKNIESRINDELRRLLHERKQGGRSVETMRIDLQEELLIGAVKSEEAKSFLERVPKLDTLLPPPEPAVLPKGAADHD